MRESNDIEFSSLEPKGALRLKAGAEPYPRKGAKPEAIWKNTPPSWKMSLSYPDPLFLICSGAMKFGVPTKCS